MTELIITSSVLILVIISLRHFLKGKISLRLQYALWALVLVRLLVPVSFFSSPISVMNLFPINDAEFEALTVNRQTMGSISAGGDVTDYSLPEQGEEFAADSAAAENSGNFDISVTNRQAYVAPALRLVWSVGIGIVGLCLLLCNLSFGWKLRKTRKKFPADGCKLPVYTVEALPSPFLFGLFRPAIYITPDVAGNETRLCHVLAHELTHYRHGDHIWSALRAVCLAVHWYNPLVWLAAMLSRRDAELACDESTIKRVGEANRMEYGRTLIGLTCEKRNVMNLLSTATTMTDGKNGIKERITLIAKKPKMLVPAFIAVLLVTFIAVGCTFTGAKNEAEIVPLTAEEVEQYNKAFEPVLSDGQGGSRINPLSHFLGPYYDKPENLNLADFLRYYPSDEDVTNEAEFEALKAEKSWPFGTDMTLGDMPVPIHKFSADTVNEVLKKYMDIALDDLSGVGMDELIYLEEYDAYYNFTSDYAAGFFICTSGETQGDIIRLYNENATLMLKKHGDSFLFVSHQRAGNASGEATGEAPGQAQDIALIGQNGEKCPLRLGMSVDEATEKMEAANIDLKGDYTDQLFSEDYSLWFTEAYDEAGQEKWVLSSISVKTPVIETAEGLKTGDAEDKIEQIYGPCEFVERDKTEGHKYYYYEMENYILRISSGSGGVFSNPDDPYYVFSWMISSKTYSNSYFPREAEGDVSLPESSVLLASLPDDQIYIYGDKNDFDTTGAYDGLYLSINGATQHFDWENTTNETFAPELYLQDISGDGRKELVVILTTGSGTGVHVSDIHVIDPDSFKETNVTDSLDIIENHVSSSIIHKNGNVIITITVNGQTFTLTLQEDYAGWWAEDAAVFKNIIRYSVEGAKLKATVPAEIAFGVFAGEVIITYAFDGSQYVMKTIEYVPYEL